MAGEGGPSLAEQKVVIGLFARLSIMKTAEPKNQWQAMVECEEKLWWYRALHGFLFRLLDRTGLPPETRVLDIGCGTGGFMKLLRERYTQVVGLDLSWLGLTHTRSRGFPSVLMADANHLPFQDNRFDLVVCIDVLEEKQVDPVRLLGEIRRVSKPEGVVLLQASAFQWLMSRHDLAVEASRRFTRPQLEGLAVDQRFDPPVFLLPLYRPVPPAGPVETASSPTDQAGDAD